VHLPNIIRPVESWTGSGEAAQKLPTPVLRQLVRRAWDEQQRFPLRVVTVLSQQFAAHGLQFFKVNKTVTHVAVARPHHLDLQASPVSEGIRRIVEFIEATPGCTRKRLLESLAPAPAPASTATAPTVAADAGPAPVPAPPPTPALPEPTPEQNALVADLHWLIHQGHVIEFANGRLETAKKPKPKPENPAAPARPVVAPASETAAPTAAEAAPTAMVPEVASAAAEATPPPATVLEPTEPGPQPAPAGADAEVPTPSDHQP